MHVYVYELKYLKFQCYIIWYLQKLQIYRDNLNFKGVSTKLGTHLPSDPVPNCLQHGWTDPILLAHGEIAMGFFVVGWLILYLHKGNVSGKNL